MVYKVAIIRCLRHW